MRREAHMWWRGGQRLCSPWESQSRPVCTATVSLSPRQQASCFAAADVYWCGGHFSAWRARFDPQEDAGRWRCHLRSQDRAAAGGVAREVDFRATTSCRRVQSHGGQFMVALGLPVRVRSARSAMPVATPRPLYPTMVIMTVQMSLFTPRQHPPKSDIAPLQ